MPGKARTEPPGQGKVGRADIACLREGLAGCGVDQVQPAACRRIAQSALSQGRLKLPPAFRLDQRFSDEEPKANEEPLVDAFGTPRLAAFGPFHLQPHKIAQHRPGSFISLTAQSGEAPPQGIIAMKKGPGHGQDPPMTGLRNP
jgi:hypothetical protein